VPGLELDASLGGIEVVASLTAALNRNADVNAAAMAEHRKREMMRARVPFDIRFQMSGVCPTPTARFGLNLGGPDSGFYWLVRRLVVGGLTFKTAAAGTMEAYITGLAGSQGQASFGPIVAGLALTDLVDQAAALPTVPHFYSNRQMTLQAGENFVVLIDTGTAGQTYVAAAQVEIHRTVSDVDTAFGS